MKILMHSFEYGPGTGGIGQYLYQMAAGLKARGHEVIVAAGNDPRVESDDLSGAQIHRFYDKQEAGSRAVAEQVLALARQHKVDVIEGADHLGECARVIGATKRPPVMIKYHGCQIIKALTRAEVVYPWQRLTVGLALARIWPQLRAERVCVEQADMVQATSWKILDDYRGQGTRVPEKCGYVPSMIAQLPELPEGDEEAERPTLLYTGRIELRKGIQYLPAMVRKVRESYPDVVLEIAGGDCYARGMGSLQKWLESQCGDVRDNVRFLGRLGVEELDAAYRRCWALVFPTKWDNCPMTVLEAMSYAKPVVTTVNGGMPDMLEGTGSPIVDPADDEFAEAVCELLGDKSRRTAVGTAGRNRCISHYSPDAIVPTYLNFLEENL